MADSSNASYYVSRATDSFLVIDALSDCGIHSPTIAVVNDWQSKNPGLAVPKPVGIDGVKAILQTLEDFRQEKGVEPIINQDY